MTLAMKDGLRDPRDGTVLCQQWLHKSKHVIKLNRTKHTRTPTSACKTSEIWIKLIDGINVFKKNSWIPSLFQFSFIHWLMCSFNSYLLSTVCQPLCGQTNSSKLWDMLQWKNVQCLQNVKQGDLALSFVSVKSFLREKALLKLKLNGWVSRS